MNKNKEKVSVIIGVLLVVLFIAGILIGQMWQPVIGCVISGASMIGLEIHLWRLLAPLM